MPALSGLFSRVYSCRVSAALGSWEQPAGPNQLDSFIAVLRIDLTHDPVDMVFDGKFREILAGGDLFIRQFLRKQVQQLDLPIRKRAFGISSCSSSAA